MQAAISVAMIWFGHILRTGHEVVQLVQGHFEVKGMLRGEVVYLPAMAFCSTFSALGCSPSTTTPSMLSAMAAVVVCEMCVGAREVQVDGRGGGGRRLLLVDAEGDGGGCGLGRQARWSCERCWCLTSALDRQEPPMPADAFALLMLPKHTRAPRLRRHSPLRCPS